MDAIMLYLHYIYI